MTERVAIVGAREHPDLEIVRAYVRSLPAGTVVITGGAKGVDLAAEVEAHDREMQVIVFLPRTTTGRVEIYGRDRMLLRNTLIAASCDRMVIFPDGSKGGCWDAAGEAQRFRRPVEARWVSGKVHPVLGRGGAEQMNDLFGGGKSR